MRAKRVLGSKTGGQQSPIPELKDPWAPECERPEEVRRGVGEEESKEEGKKGVRMSSISSMAADRWSTKIKDQDKNQGSGSG